jgi:hypothetical protein
MQKAEFEYFSSSSSSSTPWPFLFLSNHFRTLRSLAMAITTVSKFINPSPPMNFILDYTLASNWKKIKQEARRPFSLSTTLRQWGAYQYETCSSKAALNSPKNELSEGQIRRQLALKLGTTANGDLDVETQRKVASFLNSRGQTLFTQSWTPAIDKNMK